MQIAVYITASKVIQEYSRGSKIETWEAIVQ